jgi:uncharacterized Zn-finger protein
MVSHSLSRLFYLCVTPCLHCEQICMPALFPITSLFSFLKGDHTGHVCPWSGCGKIFRSPLLIEKYLRIHTGEKPFKCDFCSHAFNYKKNLKTHLLNHSGERPFKCDFCPYACNRKDVLKTHRLIHTREKPFRCNFLFLCL